MATTPDDKPIWIIPTMPRLLGHLTRPSTMSDAAKYMLTSPTMSDEDHARAKANFDAITREHRRLTESPAEPRGTHPSPSPEDTASSPDTRGTTAEELAVIVAEETTRPRAELSDGEADMLTRVWHD